MGPVGHAGSAFWRPKPVYQVKLQLTPLINTQ